MFELVLLFLSGSELLLLSRFLLLFLFLSQAVQELLVVIADGFSLDELRLDLSLELSSLLFQLWVLLADLHIRFAELLLLVNQALEGVLAEALLFLEVVGSEVAYDHARHDLVNHSSWVFGSLLGVLGCFFGNWLFVLLGFLGYLLNFSGNFFLARLSVAVSVEEISIEADWVNLSSTNWAAVFFSLFLGEAHW
jgi:hypothetical protein